MTNYLKKLFILPAEAGALREQQIREAELLALDHRANHERELAMAEMYEARAQRLKADSPAEPAPAFS